MQITLNKIAFDVRPVDGALRAALLADPAIARGVRRDVWEWDKAKGEGRFLAPVTETKGLPLPPGIAVFVQKPGTNSAGVQRADGPTAKMAERFLAAVGAKSFAQVMQGLARVTGIPQKKVPFEAFAALNPLGSYRLRLETDHAVVELASPARNLAVYAFVPGLVAFSHVMDEAPEGAPASGSIRPGFVLPPLNQAAQTIRRMATAKRLTEMQADLGDAKPNDLVPGDPRRDVIARLAAEWKALAPKPAQAA